MRCTPTAGNWLPSWPPYKESELGDLGCPAGTGTSGCNVQLWLRITDLPKLLQVAKEETEVQGNEMLTDSHVAS